MRSNGRMGNDDELITWELLAAEYRKNCQPWRRILRYWFRDTLPVKKKWAETYRECAVGYRVLLDIFDTVKIYGGVIKREYGRSKWKQFINQCQMYFIYGVQYKKYRSYQLYKVDRWKKVKEYMYENQDVEKQFVAYWAKGPDFSYDPEMDIFKNKIDFWEHCIEYELNTPPIAAKLSLNEDYSDVQIDDILPNRDLFIKTLDGNAGYGALQLNWRNNRFEDKIGNEITMSLLLNKLSNTTYHSASDKKGEFIVQPALKNCNSWSGFTSGALTTCRINSGKSIEGEIVPISATLRMPVGDSVSDNYTGGGSIISSVDLATGELGKATTYIPVNGKFEFVKHPNTGCLIEGIILPKWDELLQYVTRIHEIFDFIFVGWDITATNDGVMVIEGNGTNWSCELIEAPQNLPLKSTKYPKMFNEWMRHIQSKKY